MEQPHLLARLGKGGVSVTWAVSWSTRDRPAPCHLLKGKWSRGMQAQSITCQGPLLFLFSGLPCPASVFSFCVRALHLCLSPPKRIEVEIKRGRSRGRGQFFHSE